METPVLEIITDFLKTIGLNYTLRSINGPTLMPGILLEHGHIVIDLQKLVYPGDILHEAGHVATAPPDARSAMDGKLGEGFDYLGDEIAAQAWSYAACIHTGLDPRIVFHEGGYHNAGEGLASIFSSENPPGVPLLQWMGMTYDQKNAEKLNTLAYPNMIFWVREK